MDEKEKMLKESLEKLEIPESLRPENIEKIVDETDAAEKKQSKKLLKWKYPAMAASFALLLLVGIGIPRIKLSQEKANSSTMSETSVESTDGASVAEDISTDGIDGVLHIAKDYDEITDMIETAKKEYEREQLIGSVRGYFEKGVDYETAAVEESISDNGAEISSADAAGSYSNTNVRTEGVDEGDIVKTDGAYIYQRLSSETVRIIQIADGKMEQVATIELGDKGSGFIQELYLDGDRLVIVYDWTETELKNEENEDVDYYYTENTQSVKVATYDISDRTSPKKKGEISVDGYYRSSRYTDGYVYVMTTYGQPFYYYLYEKTYGTVSAEDVVPKVNGEFVEAKDILLPEEVKNEPFFVTTSVNVKHPSKTVDTKAVMGYVDEMYVSAKSIYFYSGNYSGNYNQTTIVKLEYEKGKILPKTAATVKGLIDDSFCIDEDANGFLRVATTLWNENWEQESSLYILDKNLKQTGSIFDFAGNEGIKSCRFLGDVGYIVTFRNTDPLFALDLSDPYNPQIASELTLPGFSEYLHSWNKDLLFGMGYDADEKTGRVGNVKLSMFDVSDLNKTSEVTTKILDDATGASVLYGDYKSLLIDPKKNLIGFYCDNGYWDDDYNWHSEGYYKVFEYSYTEGTFLEMLSVKLESSYDTTIRGLYSGDYLYLVDGKEITSYRLNTYEKVSVLGR